MICPSCKTPHENVRGKCPRCGADFHGHIQAKHAAQPRELLSEVAKRCAHGIFLHQECVKCERFGEDLEEYRKAAKVRAQEILIQHFGLTRPNAWRFAETLLEVSDANSAQQSK
jgi:hypothetical protein